MNRSKMKLVTLALSMLALMPLMLSLPSVSAAPYYYYKATKTYVLYADGYYTYYVVWVEWARYRGETISSTPQYVIRKVNYWWTYQDEYYFGCLKQNMQQSPWNYLDDAAVAGYCCSSPVCYFLADLGKLGSLG